MDSIFITPSFYAHLLNALFLLITFIIIIKNAKDIRKYDTYKIIILLILLSIAIGIHGLLHIFHQKYYNYNPIRNILNM